jgi:hypothetical protein
MEATARAPGQLFGCRTSRDSAARLCCDGAVSEPLPRCVVPAESVAQLAADLRARLAPGPGAVVLVFVSSRLDPEEVAPALAAALAPARVVGCTTERELAGATLEGTAVALVLAPPAVRVGLGLATGLTAGPLSAGRAATAAAAAELGLALEELDRERHVGFALVDGRATAAEGFCLGTAAAAPRIGMVGGSSSETRLTPGRSAIFVDGRAWRDAGLVVLLATERRFDVVMCEHMTPTQERVVVTGADPARRLITELDGFPAAPRYLARIRALGAVGPLDHQLVAEYPFAVYIDGRPYVRSIRDVDGDHLSVAAAVDAGAVLRIMRPTDLVARTTAALDELRARVGPLDVVLTCSCTARNVEAERKRLRGALDRAYASAPLFGFDSFGEQFGALLVNHTLVALAIGCEVRS